MKALIANASHHAGIHLKRLQAFAACAAATHVKQANLGHQPPLRGFHCGGCGGSNNSKYNALPLLLFERLHY